MGKFIDGFFFLSCSIQVESSKKIEFVKSLFPLYEDFFWCKYNSALQVRTWRNKIRRKIILISTILLQHFDSLCKLYHAQSGNFLRMSNAIRILGHGNFY